MFTDAFVKCTTEEIISFLERLDQEIKNHGFISEGLILLKKQILFYPDSFFYDITQADQHPSKTMQVIISKNKLMILD